jgi:hypothetical protein
MRSVKKLLIITLFLGMTFPAFAQDEIVQSPTAETQSVTAQSATSDAFLGRRRPNRRHRRGPSANRRHNNHRALPNPVVPPTPGCTYVLKPAGARALATGDVGVVTVETQAGCQWGASSNSGFIHITGANGTTVNFTVDPNPTFFVRSGSMTIAGQIYTVAQDGSNLNFDGVYDVSFTIIIQCPGVPPVGTGPFFTAWVVTGGVVNDGVTNGTISSFGGVNISSSGFGGSINFTGSVSSTGHGLGTLNVTGGPCGAGGSWEAQRR